MLDIKDFKVDRCVFLLISALFVFYCSPLPTDPFTQPPSNLKFEKIDFYAYVGEELTLTPSSGNIVDVYEILPALPTGLSINPKTGVISGFASSVSDSTKYTVLATNKNGSTKTEISITISSYPYFVFQPQSQSVTTGGTATFTSSAKGKAPLTYSWTKDGVLLTDTGNQLKITDIKTTATGTYRCVVKDERGKTVTSSPAYCQITTSGIAPKITLAPGSRSVIIGESLILLGNATGSDLEYKWLFNGTLIPNSATPYLQIESMKASDSGKYVLIVSNKFGADTSNPPAHLTIVTKTDNYFNLGIALIGKGSVIINNQTFSKDTTVKFQSGTTFTVNMIADSAHTLSSVITDNSVKTDAISSKQFMYSNFNQNHSINISFTKLTGGTPDSLFLIAGVTDPLSGLIEVASNREKFALNETVTLTAKPASGYSFAGWSGSIIGLNISSDKISIQMDADRSIMATFVRTGRYSLVKTVAPENRGTLKVTPDSIDYAVGTEVSIQAVPAAGYKFKAWSGASISSTDTLSLIMDSNKTIIATFEAVTNLDSFTIAITVPDTSAGNVVVKPIKTKYLKGDTIKLTAKANSGFKFVNWSGASSSLLDTITLTVGTNITIQANFDLAKLPLSCQISPAGSGIVSKSDTILNVGDTLPITAIPNAITGYEFKAWRQTGGAGVLYIADSTHVSTKVSISKGHVILTAVFVLKQTFTVSINGVTSNGSILIEPAKQAYFVGDTVAVTAKPEIGYVFSSWTGDLSDAAISQKIVITKSLSINALFTVGTTIQEVPVVAGNSINAEIKKVSALNIPGAILTPSTGKFDNNTIEIIGKITIPIQRR